VVIVSLILLCSFIPYLTPSIPFLDCDSEAEGRKSTTGKKERYFWQYNVQSKGPKGRKVVMQTDIGDPHFLDSVKDPVFDIQVEGVKHR